jgi:hypothetical protein
MCSSGRASDNSIFKACGNLSDKSISGPDAIASRSYDFSSTLSSFKN